VTPTVLATVFTSQVLVNGAISGLVYGLVGMGIVLVYRSTRVINFAVGAMGLPAAGVMALLVIEYGFAYCRSHWWPAPRARPRWS
jgi:branched-subunit amino acid ABC-type transport system permease component